MRYRRARAEGGTFFFTVNLADRSSTLLVDHADDLRHAIRTVRAAHPFEITAIVVLPEHLHCVWTLPVRDADYATRWSLIKAGFSRCLPVTEFIRDSRARKRERGLWQRRYWEHQIRDDEDLRRHIDYIHFNPVKHGHVSSPAAWRYSSLHRYIRSGALPKKWGDGLPVDGAFGER
jgi:putative transposase